MGIYFCLCMKLKQIISLLEEMAPPALQESYDNSGLITGNPEMEINAALICLDSTEEIIDEAMTAGCQLVIAHHPIVFSGLKKITGRNYVERTLLKAIRNDVAIYAIHTNLDNVFNGVNRMIASRLGLKDVTILAPKSAVLSKLVTYAPVAVAAKVREALFNAGAGKIGNYDECSFNAEGIGTFRPGAEANPYSGEKGKRQEEKEERIEVIFNTYEQHRLIRALKAAHPYEEVAYDCYRLENQNQYTGSGMVGDLPHSQGTNDFLKQLKERMKTGCIRHTRVIRDEVLRIAVCGGSGSFLLPEAIAARADVFVTADFKYHQFFDADGKIVIADIGHFESEQFTPELIREFLKEKIPTFAVRLSERNTNPVTYL
jgi:dinuclear metal center YbgI/SA1388 family protein